MGAILAMIKPSVIIYYPMLDFSAVFLRPAKVLAIGSPILGFQFPQVSLHSIPRPSPCYAILTEQPSHREVFQLRFREIPFAIIAFTHLYIIHTIHLKSALNSIPKATKIRSLENIIIVSMP
jgi:hypothetical protein